MTLISHSGLGDWRRADRCADRCRCYVRRRCLLERRAAGNRWSILRDRQRQPRSAQRASDHRQHTNRADSRALSHDHIDRATCRPEGMADDDLERGSRRQRRSQRPSLSSTRRRHGSVVATRGDVDLRLHLEGVWADDRNADDHRSARRGNGRALDVGLRRSAARRAWS